MKKLALVVGLAVMAFAPVALADQKPQVQGGDAVQLSDWDGICREAIHLQETRIRDLKAGIDFDRDVERKLLDGISAREADAGRKEDHARKWRELANRVSDQGKKDAFNKFAQWLETEARTDRDFARERREALRVINRQWNQAQAAIAGHERQLADLRSFCGG